MIWLKVAGIEALESALRQLSEVRFEAVEKKQLADMLKRARQPGGTPVDTGELRKSAGKSGNEIGYTKEYAAHVEFGHRVMREGKQIGYVYGQHFLKRNVDTQRPIYKDDLIKQIERFK